MPSTHTTAYTNADTDPFSGRAFYAPARDAVAYLLSGIACALLVGYVSMLVAWLFAWGAT